VTLPSLLGAQEATLLTRPGVAPALRGALRVSKAPGPHPAVVLLPGSSGWRPEYVEIADRFAEAGFAALALDYYAETGGAATGSEEKLQKWESWRRTVQAAVAYLDGVPAVASGRIALVGYSRGAFLAVSVAGSTPGVKAVIDFYGGGGGGTLPLRQEVRGLPPLLILHGDKDSVVPASFGRELGNAVLEAGGAVEMHLLPGAGHAFNLPWSATYSQDSDERSLALANHAPPSGNGAAHPGARSGSTLLGPPHVGVLHVPDCGLLVVVAAPPRDTMASSASQTSFTRCRGHYVSTIRWGRPRPYWLSRPPICAASEPGIRQQPTRAARPGLVWSLRLREQ